MGDFLSKWCNYFFMSSIQRIQKIYKTLGFNRKTFCEEIDMGYQTISNMEKRNSDPSLKLLQKVKEKFPKVSLDWVILGTGEMFISDEPIKTPEYIDKLLASMEESNKALQDNSKLLREKVLLLQKELERYDEELAKYKEEKES